VKQGKIAREEVARIVAAALKSPAAVDTTFEVNTVEDAFPRHDSSVFPTEVVLEAGIKHSLYRCERFLEASIVPGERQVCVRDRYRSRRTDI
jgi:hypothetical protein